MSSYNISTSNKQRLCKHIQSTLVSSNYTWQAITIQFCEHITDNQYSFQ